MHENRLVCREHSQILNSLNVCRQFQCYLTISHWPSNVNDAKSVWFTGCLHLYSGVEHPCFNQYPEQTDFPDPVKITAILSCNSESLNLCIVFSCWIDLYLLLIEFDSVVLFEWLKRLVYVLISDLVVNECINILNNTFTQILYNRMDLILFMILSCRLTQFSRSMSRMSTHHTPSSPWCTRQTERCSLIGQIFSLKERTGQSCRAI